MSPAKLKNSDSKQDQMEFQSSFKNSNQYIIASQEGNQGVAIDPINISQNRITSFSNIIDEESSQFNDTCETF